MSKNETKFNIMHMIAESETDYIKTEYINGHPHMIYKALREMHEDKQVSLYSREWEKLISSKNKWNETNILICYVTPYSG